jgi:hypothetical protein
MAPSTILNKPLREAIKIKPKCNTRLLPNSHKLENRGRNTTGRKTNLSAKTSNLLPFSYYHNKQPLQYTKV